MKRRKKTTYVFIDAANVFYSAKTLKYKIDFYKFIQFLKSSLEAKRVLYYTGFDPNNKKQTNFLRLLGNFGYVLKQKPIKVIKSGGNKIDKANVDVELAIDVILSLAKFDRLVLVSGDSDFAYLVKKVKKAGKVVWVVSSRGHISKELIGLADKYLPFEKLRDKIERR